MNDQNQSQVFELEVGLEFIGDHYGGVLHELKQLPRNEITFGYLWNLFRPNTLVYGADQRKQGRIYRVRGSSYQEEKRWKCQIHPPD